jgi:uncharacterized membrane protein (DUF373 family)
MMESGNIPVSLQNEKSFKKVLLAMEWLERWGYITAGVSFLALGMVVFTRGWFVFFVGLIRRDVLHPAMALMVDLLLVIIFLELFRTLLEFLKTHTLTLEPFLYIGIVAAIRRILTVTAHEALSVVSPDHFVRYMWDIGVHGILVVAFVFSLFLYKKGQ